MKKVNLITLSFLTLLFSCKTSEQCDEEGKFIDIGFKNNIYNNVDTIILINKTSRVKYLYFKVGEFGLNKKEKFCGSGCVYGGSCPNYITFKSSYYRFQTNDATKQITVANTSYCDEGGEYYDFEQFDYNIDFNIPFILPSSKDYIRTYYFEKNHHKEYIDSIYINNHLYKGVTKLCWGGSLDGPPFLFLGADKKIVRYINTSGNDTLDAE